MNGHIVWYNSTKAYGFVRPVDGGGDMVFDADEGTRARLGTIAEGMAVHFLVRHDRLGAAAWRLEAGHFDDGPP